MSAGPLESAPGHRGRLADVLSRDLLADLLTGVPCLFDPELHDGPAASTEDADERAARETVAVEVCEGCPLLAVCRRHVVRAQPPSGVWAGLTPDERAAPAHRRPGQREAAA